MSALPAAVRWRGTWFPPPGTPVELDDADPWRLVVEDAAGHRYVADVWVAAMEDLPVARGLRAAILDGLCPTCSLDWEVRAKMQRHVLDRVRDRVPAIRFRHADACPACPTREGA